MDDCVERSSIKWDNFFAQLKVKVKVKGKHIPSNPELGHLDIELLRESLMLQNEGYVAGKYQF